MIQASFEKVIKIFLVVCFVCAKVKDFVLTVHSLFTEFEFGLIRERREFLKLAEQHFHLVDLLRNSTPSEYTFAYMYIHLCVEY